MGLGAAMIGAAAAAYRKNHLPPDPDYPPVPTMYDPGVWGAGTSAGRQARTLGGPQPQGNLWQSASSFVTRLPLGVGR
jgi:hypothetical protein